MPDIKITVDENHFRNGPFAFDEGGNGAFAHGNIRVDPFGTPNSMEQRYRLTFGPSSPFEFVEYLGSVGTPFVAGGPRSYVRTFKVVLKAYRPGLPATPENSSYARYIGPSFVCGCPGLPVPYAPYIPYDAFEYDPDALAVAIAADRPDPQGYTEWIVQVTYSTEMPPGGPTFGKTKLPWEPIGNQHRPWELPPTVDVETESYTDYPYTDLDNKPYVNSAGQPPAQAYGFPKGNKTYTITRNEKDFETRQEDYVYVVNSETFKGAPAGYALCTGPRATEVWLGKTKYHRVTYQVRIKKRIKRADGTFTPGWQPQMLDAGMYERAVGAGALVGGLAEALPDTLVPIIEFGDRVTQPVLLDGRGQRQTVMTTIKIKNEAGVEANVSVPKPVYIDRREYEAVDLNVLLSAQQ